MKKVNLLLLAWCGSLQNAWKQCVLPISLTQLEPRRLEKQMPHSLQAKQTPLKYLLPCEMHLCSVLQREHRKIIERTPLSRERLPCIFYKSTTASRNSHYPFLPKFQYLLKLWVKGKASPACSNYWINIIHSIFVDSSPSLVQHTSTTQSKLP